MDIGIHDNHKSRGYTSLTYGAPVEINNAHGNMGVVVKHTDRYKYKMHRVLMPDGSMFEFARNKNDSTYSIGTAGIKSDGSPTISAASDVTITQPPEKVNPFSKENPLFSLKKNSDYDYIKPFAEQIDDWKQGKIPQYDSLLVGGTPELLKKIGFNALPMTINQQHIDYAINGTYNGSPQDVSDHYLGEGFLKQLPVLLKNPVAVIESQTHASKSVVALVDYQHNGKTVIAPVQIDGLGMLNNVTLDSNAVKTTHARRNATTKLLKDAITEYSNGGIGIYYIDSKKAAALLQTEGLQLPSHLFRNNGVIHTITDPHSKVKPKLKNITNPRQFKRWFGDWENQSGTSSKIVNTDGTPKVVYHQT